MKYTDLDGNPVNCKYIFLQYRLHILSTDEYRYYTSYPDIINDVYPKHVNTGQDEEVVKDLIDSEGIVYPNRVVKIANYFIY